MGASQPGGHGAGHNLRRQRAGGRQRVTNIELFFDLVYVFAVTQLSHYLLSRLGLTGALQTGLLLVMVWLLWGYTTWATNWLDPDRIPVRLLLLGLMLASLLMSAALPEAFGRGGLLVGVAYAVMQIGRSAFAVWALPDAALRRNYQRILCWCLVSGGLAVAGGLTGTGRREILWSAAAGVDLMGGVAGFYTPGLGRSRTREWDIEGGHFAERCQAFILIALGEALVVNGATFSRLLLGPLARPGADATPAVAAFVIAFVGSVGLWWLYFDRSAEASLRTIAKSSDPGQLGRTAYHLIHPIIVAGIIVLAAADDVVISGPRATAGAAVSWLVLGGTALYLAGLLAFQGVVFRRLSWPLVAGLAATGLLGLLAGRADALVLAGCGVAVVVLVAVAEMAVRRSVPRPENADAIPTGRRTE